MGAGSLSSVKESVVRIGMLGCGTVGASFIALLRRQSSVIESRTGLQIEVAAVAVRDLAKPRPLELEGVVLTADSMSIVTDPAIDIVVEVMGGIDASRDLVLAALQSGKPVVTANKALLAACGGELFAAAEAAGVDLLFEAAVAGGVPIIRPLRESLLAEPITRVLGIVNGTTNYILTKMTEEGADYCVALAEAQSLGYAEADPTADVEGHDAAAKVAIIASIAFGAPVVDSDVECEGISALTAEDIAFARRHGYVVKLLGVAELVHGNEGDRLSARVHPCLVPDSHPLASVRDSFNAVFVVGAAVGDLMFYGRGAGGDPTASAVLGDLVDAAINLQRGAHASIGALTPMKFLSSDELSSSFYLSLEVADRPGVLATISSVFGEHGVSIASMEQGILNDGAGDSARLDLIVHPALERDVYATIASLRALEPVRHVGSTIRVLTDEQS